MKLPNHDQCLVPDAKLTLYLLSSSHEDGAAKARFFELFGFSRDRPDELRTALIGHATMHEITSARSTEFGHLYEIRGRLNSPDGRNPVVLVVWMILTNETQPRLVTAVPSRD